MNSLDIHQIKNYLPHRYPFLLVDRVLQATAGESLVALKNVTYNEPFFEGHFPSRPVMPGVLIVEALAQACAILASPGISTTRKVGLATLSAYRTLVSLVIAASTADRSVISTKLVCIFALTGKKSCISA